MAKRKDGRVDGRVGRPSTELILRLGAWLTPQRVAEFHRLKTDPTIIAVQAGAELNMDIKPSFVKMTLLKGKLVDYPWWGQNDESKTHAKDDASGSLDAKRLEETLCLMLREVCRVREDCLAALARLEASVSALTLSPPAQNATCLCTAVYGNVADGTEKEEDNVEDASEANALLRRLPQEMRTAFEAGAVPPEEAESLESAMWTPCQSGEWERTIVVTVKGTLDDRQEIIWRPCWVASVRYARKVNVIDWMRQERSLHTIERQARKKARRLLAGAGPSEWSDEWFDAHLNRARVARLFSADEERVFRSLHTQQTKTEVSQ